MRILHIAEPFATGVLSFIQGLANEQAKKHEVYIIYGRRPLMPENVEELFDRNIKMFFLSSFKGAFGSCLNPQAYKDIRKLYNDIKPDIIHMHSSASGFIGRWALPCRTVKSFYTPHGFAFHMQDYSYVKKNIFYFMEYLSAKRGGTIVACSKNEYKEALRLSKNSNYVYNGIDTDSLTELIREPNINAEKIKIGTTGRIMYQKNPMLFNEMAIRLPQAEFVWIGEGKDEDKQYLKADNIRITGWLSRDDAMKELQNLDVFVQPSFGEGLSISLLEAMYIKKICIVSDVIGSRDVIRNNQNGFICNTGQEYADRIVQIAQDKEMAFRITQTAHDEVLRQYSVHSMCAKYDRIYNGEE